jgi:hypothetical protein
MQRLTHTLAHLFEPTIILYNAEADLIPGLPYSIYHETEAEPSQLF